MSKTSKVIRLLKYLVSLLDVILFAGDRVRKHKKYDKPED